MKKSIRIFLVFLSIGFITFFTSTIVFAKVEIPQATEKFYVNDFADVFSETEEDELMEKAVNLAEKTDGVQVVVTTIKSLEGEELEEYANEMYNSYGIGKDDMGLLILLSTEDRQIRVEVGRKMEGYIPDSKAGRFIDDYAIPSLKENKFNEGLIELQGAFVEEISTNVTKVEESSSNDTIDLTPIIAIVLLISIIALIYFMIRKIVEKIKQRKMEIQNLKQEIDNLKLEAKEESKILTSRIQKLQNERDCLSEDLRDLEKSYNILNDHYQRAKKIYPDVEKKVFKMVEEEIIKADKDKAKQVDLTIRQIINQKPSKDIFFELEKAYLMYQHLTEKQKQYVQSDVDKLVDLYQESSNLKDKYEEEQRIKKCKESAKKAKGEILGLIDGISRGRASNYRRIRNAKKIYDNLDSSIQEYFDGATLLLLQELFSQAKRDKEREELEERERRERERRDSDGGFGDFGGFSGFGGSSGGGGASRGF